MDMLLCAFILCAVEFTRENLTVKVTDGLHSFHDGENAPHRSLSNWHLIQRGIQGSSLVVQWLQICLSMQGLQVQSLIGDLRSYTLQSNSACVPQLQSSALWQKILSAATKTRCSQIHVSKIKSKRAFKHGSMPAAKLPAPCTPELRTRPYLRWHAAASTHTLEKKAAGLLSDL